MNEIEKMYENAKVKADRVVCYRGFDNCIDNDFNCHCHSEKPCKDATKIYPPFTANKQIELIKLLGSMKDYTIEIQKFKGDYYVECRSAGSNDKFWGSSYAFEYAIAELVNDLWQDLTKEEKRQIKEILDV